MTNAQNAVRILSVFLLFVGSVLIPRTQINGQIGTSMFQEGGATNDVQSQDSTSKHLLTVNDETADSDDSLSTDHSDDEMQDTKQFNFHEIFARLHVNDGGKETDFMDQQLVAQTSSPQKTSLASTVASEQQQSNLEALADVSSDDGEESSGSESTENQITEPQPTPQAQALQCLAPILDSVETVCSTLTQVRSTSKPLWRKVKKSYRFKNDKNKKQQLLGLYNALLKVEVARKTLQKQLGCSTCWAATSVSTNSVSGSIMATSAGVFTSRRRSGARSVAGNVASTSNAPVSGFVLSKSSSGDENTGCVDCSVRTLETVPTACSVLASAISDADRLSFVISHSTYLKSKYPETYQVSSSLSTTFKQLSTQLKCGEC